MTSGGLADQGGICLGDIILEINEEDATQLTLAEANEKINAAPAKKILFLLRKLISNRITHPHPHPQNQLQANCFE